jgi:hypothetical protein
MQNYIFLDNWVYSLLTDPENERRLSAFIQDRGYTILITSLSLVELYNPQPLIPRNKDRTIIASNFLSEHPCIIVNPVKVWHAEMTSYPKPLSSLPIELDLMDIKVRYRKETLLRFLKRDEQFLRQGRDILKWTEDYELEKNNWLQSVEAIINHAITIGYLKRDARGRLTEIKDHKELFLISLDLRFTSPDKINIIFPKLIEQIKEDQPTQLTAVRLLSLCIWYTYVDVDNANRIKKKGSDIGDIYHISLMPYCAVFTTDGSMYRMLQRINEPILPVSCEIITKKQLVKYLHDYT